MVTVPGHIDLFIVQKEKEGERQRHTERQKESERVREKGRRGWGKGLPPPTPGREKILFVCSLKLLFQETQAYGSGWCGGRVWVVYLLLPLPFAW